MANLLTVFAIVTRATTVGPTIVVFTNVGHRADMTALLIIAGFAIVGENKWSRNSVSVTLVFVNCDAFSPNHASSAWDGGVATMLYTWRLSGSLTGPYAARLDEWTERGINQLGATAGHVTKSTKWPTTVPSASGSTVAGYFTITAAAAYKRFSRISSAADSELQRNAKADIAPEENTEDDGEDEYDSMPELEEVSDSDEEN